MEIKPSVEYGFKEEEYAGERHAMTEVGLIAYLMEMGYDLKVARRIVASWEVNEKFPY